MAHRGWVVPALVVLGAAVAVGCSDDDAKGPGPTPTVPNHEQVAPKPTVVPKTNIEIVDNGFESDDPNPQSSRGASSGSSGSTGGDDDDSPSSSSSSSSGGPSAPPSDGSAQRAVQEADIVKLDGNRLYALSQYGGLAVVDVSDPDHLRLLGRKRSRPTTEAAGGSRRASSSPSTSPTRPR